MSPSSPRRPPVAGRYDERQMATEQQTELPLYRLELATYRRLARAGALAGMDVELRDGLLLDRHPEDRDRIHRIDVQTYHRMGATGALEGLRIELLDGLLVAKEVKSAAHILAVGRLNRYFVEGSKWWVQVQDPVEAAFDSEPEPDLLVSRCEPAGGQILRTAELVVEVAVSTHRLDRGRKATLYARADIPTYWLVDIPGRAVEVRLEPGPDGYGRCRIYREAERVPCRLEGVEDLEVAKLLAGMED